VNEKDEGRLDLLLRIMHAYTGGLTSVDKLCKATGRNFKKDPSLHDRFPDLGVGDTVICIWSGNECLIHGTGGRAYSYFNSLVKLAAKQGDAHFSRIEE
jgi:hypothetical protein